MAGGIDFASGVLGYQRQQEALIMDRQKVQENAMSLQVQAIGAKNQQVEAQAGTLYNPEDPKSLDNVASFLFQHGDYKAGLAAVKEKQDIGMKNLDNAMTAQKLQDNQMQEVGGIIGSMKASPEAYAQGIIRLGAMGQNPAKFGLTGDPSVDGPNLDSLGQSFIKMKDQADLIQKKATALVAQNRVDETDRHNKEMESIAQDREANAEARVKVQADAEDRHAKTAASIQAGKTTAWQTNAQKLASPGKFLRDDALIAINNDPDIGKDSGMPEEQRKQIANLAATRAGAVIAKKLNPNNPDWEPSDFDDEVANQLQKMKDSKEVSAYKKPDWTTGWRGAGSGGLSKPQAAAAPAAGREAAGKIAPPKVVDPNTLTPGSIWTSKSGASYKVVGKNSKGEQQFEPIPKGQ